MINKHITFYPNKFNKNLNIIDLTFGLGGYNYITRCKKVIAIDINFSSIKISRKIFKKNFFIFNIKIKYFFLILKRFNFKKNNFLIYDQGFNSCEIKFFYYKLNKKNYIIKKSKINNNLRYIFNKIIFFFEKKFFLIITIFNFYEYYKVIFFVKKVKKFKIKIFKLNFFEICLNNGLKNSIMIIIYV